MKVIAEKAQNPWFFRLWIVSVVFLALTVTVLITAWAVRKAATKGPGLTEAQAKMVLAVATFPSEVKASVLQMVSSLAGDPNLLLLDRMATEKSHWQRIFPSAGDTGYLLFSGVDREARRSIVSLIRVADGTVLARWVPDWKYVISRTTPTKYLDGITEQNIRAVHPILLPDGDLIFNTGGAMVRMSTCSSKPVWVLNEVMHHSNEQDNDGYIWAPSVSTDGFADNPWLLDQVRDDALAKVSLDGKLLERLSFSKIMRENGLSTLLLGFHGFQLNDDPIHLNQIAVARTSTDYWQRGDLLISARHLSTVFLYRPSTGRIVWYQTGPWMNQHSVAFVGDHQISVFNNNVVGGAPISQPFLVPGDTNRVMVYDFKTQKVSEPYASLLAAAKPVTLTEGRAQLLQDGGLFLEESNFGRHLRFSKDQLLWSRVNDYDEKRIGMLAWSRYLTQDEVMQPLKAIANLNCTERP